MLFTRSIYNNYSRIFAETTLGWTWGIIVVHATTIICCSWIVNCSSILPNWIWRLHRQGILFFDSKFALYLSYLGLLLLPANRFLWNQRHFSIILRSCFRSWYSPENNLTSCSKSPEGFSSIFLETNIHWVSSLLQLVRSTDSSQVMLSPSVKSSLTI